MNILVVAPHGDDEVLGCGGTIAKHIENGDNVISCIVTMPFEPKWTQEYIEKRYREIDYIEQFFHISQTYTLCFKPTLLNKSHISLISDTLYDIIDKHDIDIMYIPNRDDLHGDHSIVHDACLVASRPIEHKINKILAYETLSETEWGIDPFKPNYYIDITEYIYKKLDGMDIYNSELKTKNNLRSIEGIQTLARKRGMEINTKYAESFKLIRQIE